MQRHLSTDICCGWKNLKLQSQSCNCFFDQETWEGKVADAVIYRPQVDITAFKHELLKASTREGNYSAFLNTDKEITGLSCSSGKLG